ncbi:MAG: hypothetical protein MJ131_10350 [Lachnospiraceae bacterium]|nr:hypothetical protein [Lachnospiraceae bacterium]
MTTTTIYCRPTAKGIHSFFLETEDMKIFLFSQPYRKGVGKLFGNGLMLSEALKYKKAHNDNAIIKTISKLPTYIRYVEKEYGIAVFEKTKKLEKRVKAA